MSLFKWKYFKGNVPLLPSFLLLECDSDLHRSYAHHTDPRSVDHRETVLISEDSDDDALPPPPPSPGWPEGGFLCPQTRPLTSTFFGYWHQRPVSLFPHHFTRISIEGWVGDGCISGSG